MSDLIPASKVHALINEWRSEDVLKLCVGEMSAQELRAVRAVLGAIEREFSIFGAALKLAKGDTSS